MCEWTADRQVDDRNGGLDRLTFKHQGRYYRLTDTGIALLEAEGQRLADNAKLVQDGLRRVRTA